MDNAAQRLPMRLSIEKGDAGYEAYARIIGEGSDVEIYLDGVSQRGCLTADRVEGWIKRFVEPFEIVGDEMKTEIVRGDVEFKIRSAQQA